MTIAELRSAEVRAFATGNLATGLAVGREMARRRQLGPATITVQVRDAAA